MQVNVGYAYGQLVRARAKGDAKGVAKWEAVIAGMRSGTIAVGSRTPTKAPAWVTLDVVTGGFATGTYAAGGAVTPHEQALGGRLAANLHYLEDADGMLASGRYRIDVPEEGALLALAWLRGRGAHAEAQALLETIAPWFATLRFFPAPAARAGDIAETVRVQDLGVTVDELDEDRAQARLDAQRAAELVWKPLYDRAIALWLETVEGAVPRVVGGEVTGGMPGRVFPDGFRAWVHALAAECRGEKTAKTDRATRVIQLVELLARIATHPNALDDKALAHVRRRLAQFVTAHGVPGTQAFLARRLLDARAVAQPRHADLRRARSSPASGRSRASAVSTSTGRSRRSRTPRRSALPCLPAPRCPRT